MLQQMDPTAVHLDLAAADRRSGQHAFVHLADLGGMGLPGARLLPAAQNCFEDALRGNNLGRARSCLDAWIAIEGSSDSHSAKISAASA